MTWTRTKLAIAGVAVWIATAASCAAECRQTSFESVPMTVCTADPRRDDLRTWLYRADGEIIGTFARLRSELAREGADLGFAMNGGMYHDDRSPVGHFIEDGIERQRVITSAGPGNFGMLPNGVFCLADDTASVIESRRYETDRPNCRFATQSGPMLVINGELHPRFIPDSDSRFIRNGVGITSSGSIVAAISDRPVNFHRFARFFRDVLDTPNALYLDGKVSRLYAADLDRSDPGFPMGPILGTVVRSD